MNTQRKVVITTTYNEMGIIIDTKAEEVTQPNLQPTCNQFATDTISRQQAIEALKTDMASLDHIIKGMSAYDVRLDAYVSQRNQVDCDIDTISNLPPAQPEREKGEWVYGEHDAAMCDGYRCNHCGFFVPWDYKYTFIDFIKDYHFCPNCGAKMEGGEHK